MKSADCFFFWHCFLIMTVNKSFYPWAGLENGPKADAPFLRNSASREQLSHSPPLPLILCQKQKHSLFKKLEVDSCTCISFGNPVSAGSTLDLPYWPLSQKRDLSSVLRFFSINFPFLLVEWPEWCPPPLLKDMSIFLFLEPMLLLLLLSHFSRVRLCATP